MILHDIARAFLVVAPPAWREAYWNWVNKRAQEKINRALFEDSDEEEEEEDDGVGLSVVEEVPPHIARKYRRTSPTTWACKTCASKVRAIAFTPVNPEQRDSYGRFIDKDVIPYCPKCETPPWPPWPSLPMVEAFCESCAENVLFTIHDQGTAHEYRDCQVCGMRGWDR